MVTSYSDVEDEHIVQTKLSLDSSSLFVLESIHEPSFEPNHIVVTELVSTVEPYSSSQTIPQPITTNVSPLPILLLDSVILKDVCENIFVDLNKLVKTRSNFIHKKNYEDEWISLRERELIMLCVNFRSCL